MSSQNSRSSIYPEVDMSNPEAASPLLSDSNLNPSSSLYPTVYVDDLAQNLFPDQESDQNPNTLPSLPVDSSEEVLIIVPATIVHLIDKQRSVELASGDLIIVRLRQGENVVAVFARIGEDLQWPLAKDEPVVKLDESHYFFTLRIPSGVGSDDEGSIIEEENILNYGLTIASKGQEGVLESFDSILDHYSAFSIQKVAEVADDLSAFAKETSPDEFVAEGNNKKEEMESSSAAYWTTLAPNVEDYSSSVARMIAAGSGQLIKGILWCGDVTVERLKWGNEFFKKRMCTSSNSDVSPEAMKRILRVKKLTKMSEKVATGVLSGVVRVSGFFTSSIVNSSVGKKFFSLLPGEIVLASLDGFNKICDAVEVAGRNVMSTSSVVTTGLVSHRYGEQAGKATYEGLGAAGHALGAAWAVFKVRKALNPKSVIKPTTLVKAAAQSNSEKLKAKK
ncbi:protein EARLY-RESPONSIVE TO DEHYDRATION 7, chloroplastic-like [Impatiens glandulifera]|uniref:protein EARLY-RESPONSIVE TO DEHYDRATION 7, chloroplastic-like n=1 Tax=Impatiens glandulifera TaxID=253017 RepID=UPI001FB0B710|nr:protein EARLY-RESPONSIVE TO DEHYDRATION 7, chloroplastic-like [Impatiens glandulifera]